MAPPHQRHQNSGHCPQTDRRRRHRRHLRQTEQGRGNGEGCQHPGGQPDHRPTARLANVCRHADVKVAVDSAENVAAIGAAATTYGTEVGVVIELNTGMERSGVLPGEATLALARTITTTPGVRFRGLMTWEGQTLTIKDPGQKRQAIEQSIAQMASSARSVPQQQHPGRDRLGRWQRHLCDHALSAGYGQKIQAGGAIFCDVAYQSC